MPVVSAKDHCAYDAVPEGVEPCHIAEVSIPSVMASKLRLTTPQCLHSRSTCWTGLKNLFINSSQTVLLNLSCHSVTPVGHRILSVIALNTFSLTSLMQLPPS